MLADSSPARHSLRPSGLNASEANPCAPGGPVTFIADDYTAASHDWEFNNDGVVDAVTSSRSITHTCPNYGTYSVQRTVTGSSGTQTGTFSNAVDLPNQSHVAPYVQYADGLNQGWTTFPSGGYREYQWNTATSSNYTSTGPAADHTTGTGVYVHIESHQRNYNFGTSSLYSPCIELPAANPGDPIPELRFWYHMYGSQMGTLEVDVLSSAGRATVFTRSGQQHGSATAPWSEAIVPLGSYAGQDIQLIFTGTTQSRSRSNMAIYEISISLVSPPLPAELISFTGTLTDGQHHELTWRTASETRLAHFVLESAGIAGTFAPVAQVPATGTPTTPAEYMHTVRLPGAGQHYYRLRSVDEDGTEEISSTIAIAGAARSTSLSASPNPFTDELRVFGFSITEPVEIAELSTGRVVASYVPAFGEMEVRIPVDGLAPGIYLIRSGSAPPRCV